MFEARQQVIELVELLVSKAAPSKKTSGELVSELHDEEEE